MIAFDDSMFPDAIRIQRKSNTSPASSRGAPKYTWADPGDDANAYVEVTTGIPQRRDGEQQQPKAMTVYRVFTATDPNVADDDRIAFVNHTLVVTAPAIPQGAGTFFLTHCRALE